MDICLTKNDAGAGLGSSVIFKSTDEGSSWGAISPDLTRNDPKTLGSSGGPITKDHTGVETYGTIFTFAPSAAVRLDADATEESLRQAGPPPEIGVPHGISTFQA